MSGRVWTAALVVIGDEILSGRTQDRNTGTLARWLGAAGIRLREVRVVADDIAAIGGAVNALRSVHDYLFTTGGIGPTHDDITVDAIAAALGRPVIHHPRAVEILTRYYGDAITETRLRMARVPEGAELIENARTGAPGVRVGNILILAGVPQIMQTMLDALEGALEGGEPLAARAVGAWTPESEAAAILQAIERDHSGVAVGSYPFWRDGRVGANFVLRGVDPAQLDAAQSKLRANLAAAGIDSVDGEI